jgi:helicase
MNVSELVLKQNGFENYNPVQEKCLDKINSNLVVSAPTASGKTIIAELFLLEQILNHKKKVIYTAPLRALASEHYKDFKNKYRDVKFALSTGDFDSNSSYLKKFDCVFTTYEKLASLLRHKAEFLDDVGCLIVDEIHELDSDRGAVLEIAITQLKNRNKNLKVLGLSATIPNSKELSEWLDSELVESKWRPVKLTQGIEFDNKIEYLEEGIVDKDIEDEIDSYLEKKKQILVFLNSRKRAESQADKMSKKTKEKISEKDKEILEGIANKILNVLEQPTSQCHLLSECVKKGIAFHHAGLLSKQRELIENNFRSGKIHIICATPTLAAGVNTPADLVVIPSLYRYSKFGMDLIPVREYAQMSGRSGRPKYSDSGRSIVKANNESQKEIYLEKYLAGELEPINSKLALESVLRTHVLGLVATGDIFDDKSIWKFFEGTLYAKQFGSVAEIYEKVSGIIDELKKINFVTNIGSYFKCTLLGKRVSDLFLDPVSANTLVNALKDPKAFDELSYLFTWSNMSEFYPRVNLPKKNSAVLLEEFNENIRKLPFSEADLFFETDALEVYFNAVILKEWISETKEQTLFENFGVLPGMLFSKTRIIEWLSYSTIEIAKVLDEKRHILPSKKLALRMKHGVREELLSLVELRGIGRARARKLFINKITKPSDIKKNKNKVEAILGRNVAKKVFEQLKID